MEIVLTAMLGWLVVVLTIMLGCVVAICLMMVMRGIVRQDEKVFKAGCLGMLSIIVGTLIGVLITYTMNVVIG